MTVAVYLAKHFVPTLHLICIKVDTTVFGKCDYCYLCLSGMEVIAPECEMW